MLTASILLVVCILLMFKNGQQQHLGVKHCRENHRFTPIEPLKYREDIGKLLQGEGFSIGAELGVKTGEFARRTLQEWRSCSKYVLVDAWRPLENYKDIANGNVQVQEHNFKQTIRNLTPYRSVIEICRNYTTSCAKKFDPDTFDYIYIDARHDFKGVLTDLRQWYPLLKQGGIFAGHDYVTQDDGPQQGGQDWTINFDGKQFF